MGSIKLSSTIWAKIDQALDFVYPRNIYCIVCGIGILPSEEFSICPDCRSKIFFIEGKACLQCGKPIAESGILNTCPDCSEKKRFFTRGFSCVEYEGEIKEIIHRFKYGGQRHLMHPLGAIMVHKLKAEGLTDVDRVIPVPLHKRRERQRGFNQAELLARVIAREMGWKLDKKVLVRLQDTRSQSDLTKQERQRNVRDAFGLFPGVSLKGEKVLLVDDIYTTGSTMDSCSRTLRQAEPAEIYILSLATGRNV
ncbi:MAG TPA: ComF family protein [Clostridiales bacterium]|nr:ComF family protein [Clostridiales bacterium]